MSTQRVEHTCDCGHVVRCDIGHYQLVRCRCGIFYWALQPKRQGPFALFKWPGTAEMLRFKRQKALAAMYKIYHDSGLQDFDQ